MAPDQRVETGLGHERAAAPRDGRVLAAEERFAPGRRRVVLVGNPNVGKSVLFQNLTRRYVTVSNFPGTTVEIARAQAAFNGEDVEVVDTPGINDLEPQSDDARVTRRLLDQRRETTLLQVADAKNLRRALLLTLQLAELGQPMVLVLNMCDELAERGGRIDTARLAALLGVPVVEAVAVRGDGTAAIVAALAAARPPRRELVAAAGETAAATAGAERTARTECDACNGRREPACDAGDGGDTVGVGRATPVSVETPAGAAPIAVAAGEDRAAVAGTTIVSGFERNRARLERVHQILAETYAISPPRHATFKVRLGFWAMHPVKGLGLLALVLYGVFWLVGLVGAGTLVDLLETGLFGQRLNPLAIRAADALLPFPHHHPVAPVTAEVALPLSPVHALPLATLERAVAGPAYALTVPAAELGTAARLARFAHDFLVGEYGAVTMALSYALAIVLPIVTVFFLLFSLLEDSGYLPRMAILVNRLFRVMGLNGKAVLPMILGLGCDTMATVTTRILETRKERVVTTMLLALAIPCSAQLGVLLAMTARLSLAAALFWLALMVAILLAVGALTARLFPGPGSDFLLELPPMRRPRLANVLMKTVGRLEWYLKEVIPLFLVGTAALFVLDRLGWLDVIAGAGRPLVTGWLGLPPEAAQAFLLGFMRRDFGAVWLLDAAIGAQAMLSPHQILVAMVTITLFMPCVANFLMIAREHGLRTAWAMAAFIFPFAFLTGGVVHRLVP